MSEHADRIVNHAGIVRPPRVSHRDRPLRPLRSTTLALAATGLVLVVAVGLQAPAVSGGLRWRPAPRRLRPGFEVLLEDGGPIAGNVAVREDPWFTSAVLAIIAIVLALGLAWWLQRVLRRHLERTRTRPAALGGTMGAPMHADARIVQSGLASALQILDSDPVSGNAIVRAWQRVEEAAADAGLERRPAETASEFTARILRRSEGAAAPIGVLLSVFQRVRFGHHVPDAHELETARAALLELGAIWQSELPARRASRAAG